MRHSNVQACKFSVNIVQSKQKIHTEQTKNISSLLSREKKKEKQLSPTAVFGDCHLCNVHCHFTTSFTWMCKTRTHACKHSQRRPRSSPYCSCIDRASDKNSSQQRLHTKYCMLHSIIFLTSSGCLNCFCHKLRSRKVIIRWNHEIKDDKVKVVHKRYDLTARNTNEDKKTKACTLSSNGCWTTFRIRRSATAHARIKGHRKLLFFALLVEKLHNFLF